MSDITDSLTIKVMKPGIKQALVGIQADNFVKDLFSSVDSDSTISIQLRDGVQYIDKVFTVEESDLLCSNIDQCPNRTFWNASGRDNEAARQYRDADTIEIHCESFVDVIWNRIKSAVFLPNIVIGLTEYDSMGIKDHKWERELPGTWVPIGLNYDCLLARYPSGGHFAPHTDGNAIHDLNHRSFQSVIIYLNDIPMEMGGGTRFYHSDVLKKLKQTSDNIWSTDDPSYILLEVQAKCGRILIFDQNLTHEGIPVKYPYKKYIIRSDIIYERQPPIFTSEIDKLAYKLFKQAEELSEQGQIDESIILFKKAIKMSPEQAHWMGH